MSKATQAKLDKLHDPIASYYVSAVESGEELSSGTLAAINAFLKNNNVTADVVESSPLQNLTYKLQDILRQEREEAN